MKFAGNYHGHSDALLLAEGGSGVARRLGAARLGRRAPPARSPTRRSCPTTSVPALDDDVACVIVEPVAANMGLVAPGAGFLEGCAPSATASARC